MLFSCKTQNLKEAIMKVERIVSKQTTLPILGNILIKTEKGRLSVSATNLEIAIKVFLGAKIEEEGEITVSGRILGGFLSSIKDDKINGRLEKNILEIKTEKHKIKINGIEATDFPIIPQNPNNYLFKIKNVDLIRAISSVLISVAKNDTRQELNGIYIQFKENSISLASTDSFRLSEAIIELNKDFLGDNYLDFIKNTPSIIIPALTFIEIQRVMSSIDDEIEFMIDQNQLFVKNTSVRIISRLINGNYPEYQQVLPEKYAIEIILNKQELLDALKISSLILGGVGNEVQIRFEDKKNKILISSQSEMAGNNLSEILVKKIKGEDFEVIFNCRYLMDGLSILGNDDGNIMLKLNKTKSPVLIREVNKLGKENERLSYVVMPIIKG
jgi:DNA polymerase-3 subunit beta